MIVSIILSIVSGLAVGVLGAYITNWEREIYIKYFPVFLWVLAIAAAIFYTLDLTIALTLTFMFFMTLSWLYSTKFLKIKK